MASVSYWSGSWQSAGLANDLQPGQTHSWFAWGFNWGEALSISAHAVTGAPVQRFLSVEDVRIETDPNGRRIYFTIRNVGSVAVPGYAIGFGRIGP